MNKKKVILIGDGGHTKVLFSQFRKLSDFEIIGLIDNYKLIGSLVMAVKIIGTNNDS